MPAAVLVLGGCKLLIAFHCRGNWGKTVLELSSCSDYDTYSCSLLKAYYVAARKWVKHFTDIISLHAQNNLVQPVRKQKFTRLGLRCPTLGNSRAGLSFGVLTTTHLTIGIALPLVSKDSG